MDGSFQAKLKALQPARRSVGHGLGPPRRAANLALGWGSDLRWPNPRGGPMRSTVLANRRKARRHAVHIACQVVRERDFRLVSDRILNLSISGLVVATAEPAIAGERLLVSFRLPRTTYWIDTEATVTR